MSRNGSGVYSLPAGNPVVTGTTISSSWANTTLSDIASALTASIANDGQTLPVANLPMGTYAHTGVGNATARTMYASAAQVEDGTLNYLTSVSGTNTITATAPLSMLAYATGQTFRFIAAGANTSSVTLNINSIGAKAIVRTDGSALVSGDIASGAAVQVFYDGTNFQLLNDANGQSETVTTLTATTKVVTPQVGSSSGSFTIQSANTTAITVDSSQNVGIGTPNMRSSRLSVEQTGTTIKFATFSNAVDADIEFKSTASALVAIGPSVAANFAFQTNNTERMRIDSSGNVGIGTSSPAYLLNVSKNGGGSNSAQLARFTDTNTTNSVGPFHLTMGAANHFANNPSPVICGTNGLGFGVGDGSDLANQRKMMIDSSGNVLVGTADASPTAGNGIKVLPGGFGGFAITQVWVGNTVSSSEYWGMVRSTSNNSWRFYGDYAGNLYAQSTSIISLSDVRLKENIRDLDTGLDVVMSLKPRRFDWKESQGQDKKDVAGFIAQEVEPILPEIVTTGMDKDENGDKYKMLAQGMLIPTLVKAIQEQQELIKQLQADVALLKGN